MSKILSIDWDVFFPDSSPYDWGANEENPIFYEIIWHTRCDSRNIFTGKHMLDEYVPNIPDNFWRIVSNNPKVVVVADSHFRIWYLLERLGYNNTVVHLDAHHDCGYGEKKSNTENININCGNWAKWGVFTGRIKELKLHYPEWRKGKEEWDKKIPPEISNVDYGLPRRSKYDAIFICRSSCWTPPWYDRAFLDFFKVWSFDKNISFDQRNVEDPRSMTIEQAREISKQMQFMMKQMKEENAIA